MSEIPSDSPVRRVREALGNLPEETGLHRCASIRGFARFVGCSEGAIRNVESGGVKLSTKLAELIQSSTGVSAQWLLGDPAPSDPILGRRGLPWHGEDLDLLSYLPGLKPMIVGCPSSLPSAVGKLVETLLAEHLRRGKIGSLVVILKQLQMHRIFDQERAPGGILERVAAASPWMDEKLPPLLADSLEVLVDRSRHLSRERLQKLEYLKSVEPEPSLGPSLMEGYRGLRQRSLDWKERHFPIKADDGLA